MSGSTTIYVCANHAPAYWDAADQAEKDGWQIILQTTESDDCDDCED